jgi:iron uptake system component EfeO
MSRVKLTASECGGRWNAGHSGQADIAVDNSYSETAEVYLANARTGAVYDEIEGLAPGAQNTLTGTLGTGAYQLQCYTEENNPRLGPVVHIVNADPHSQLTPGLIPVTFAELVPTAKAYQAWVSSRLPVLLSQVDTLAKKVESGSTPAAKSAWLTAHLSYEKLGAAYDAFGPLDDAINGSPSGSQTWRQDKRLTGFHLIEGLLWSGAPAAKLVPAVVQLRQNVQLLIKQFATAEIAPSIIALRAHEIVENAIQFELTGHTDAGSHTNLATISANLWGAQKTLSFVAGLLRPRYPQLGQTERALAASERLIASYHHGAHWTPLQSLGTLGRERVNASLEGLVEMLAPVAAITEIRNVPRGDGIAR